MKRGKQGRKMLQVLVYEASVQIFASGMAIKSKRNGVDPVPSFQNVLEIDKAPHDIPIRFPIALRPGVENTPAKMPLERLNPKCKEGRRGLPPMFPEKCREVVCIQEIVFETVRAFEPSEILKSRNAAVSVAGDGNTRGKRDGVD
jgi:hypothetical protein